MYAHPEEPDIAVTVGVRIGKRENVAHPDTLMVYVSDAEEMERCRLIYTKTWG